tara:strand:- start:358 stop:1914 length:1557 start_codon:yes stop_codon:yes gene_type:complete
VDARKQTQTRKGVGSEIHNIAQTEENNQAEKEKIKRKIEILKKLKDHENFNAIEYYDPYPYQKRYHDTGKDCVQRLLMAGNRIGKSFCGAAEISYHLRGVYPENWWDGKRFSKPITAWVGGVSNETTRDIMQAALLGEPSDPKAKGTGAIPKSCILKTERKPGIPNAVQIAHIKHVSGGTSYLVFKSYEMSASKWFGAAVDIILLDEEPPPEIYSQALVRVLSKQGQVMMTFTPENGITKIVSGFMNNLQPGQSLTNAGWDDASEHVKTVIHQTPGHLSESVMAQIEASLSPHEREMRRKGIPSIGSGLVFPIPEDKLMVEPYPIPDDWLRISGLDLGWDHPTALVTIAIDPETWGTDEESIVVCDCYGASKTTPSVHAEAIRQRNTGPVAWPHDGNRRDSMGNPGLAEQYRDLGVDLLPEHFRNPPALGEKKGNNSIQTGLQKMVTMMEAGRFKVFSNLTAWWDEYRIYHYKDNKVVAMNDDYLSATRYAVMSSRFAQSNDNPSWGRELEYEEIGIF